MKNLIYFILLIVISSSEAQVSDFKNIDFKKADNIAKLHEGSSLENLPLLAHHLTHDLSTDVEKFRAIYTWVCNNIKGDPGQENKITRKRKKLDINSLTYLNWNSEYTKKAFKKLIKQKKTMCTGYAYLIKELCFFSNIDCKIIDGYGRTINANVEKLELINHSWNAVKLNNKWYLCDATWSSGYLDSYNVFIKDYNDGYFLTDPVLFATNHYPVEKEWLLNDSLINSKFAVSPIVYGETFTRKIIPVSPRSMSLTTKKLEEINFSFRSLNNVDINDISLIQFAGNKEKPFIIYDLKNEDGLVSFKSTFNRSRSYDVHLKINQDIVASYAVKVID